MFSHSYNNGIKSQSQSGQPLTLQYQSGMCFSFQIVFFSFSWDQEAGAVKRPLNATGPIAAMHLIISVLFFVPDPRRKKSEFRLFKSFKDMNFEVEHNYHYV